MANGKVIVLNGASCTGKTTLARAIQRVASEPYLIISLDQFRDAMPDRYRGLNAPAGTTGAEGLNIVPVEQEDELRTSIRFGDYGETVLKAMRRSALACVQEGLNVIMDDVINRPSFGSDYVSVFKDLDVLFVSVTCDREEMVRREQARAGRFPGTALTTLSEVHQHMTYDIEVDTTNASPDQLAQTVLHSLESSDKERVIQSMKE